MKCLVIGIVTSLIGLSVVQASDKVQPYLKQQLEKSEQANVIVYFSARAKFEKSKAIAKRADRIQSVVDEARQVASSSQKNVLRYLKKQSLKHRSFFIENAIAVESANASQVQWLATRPEVEAVRTDAKSKLNLPDVDPTEGLSPGLIEVPDHLELVGASKVWNELGVKGRGIVVAGQDTGYQWTHESIRNQYRGYRNGQVNHNYNWHDAISADNRSCNGRANAPCDDNGHGTHTMGTIVGYAGENNQIGVAPESKWIGCRNMGQGIGTVSSYLECFQFFIAPFVRGDLRGRTARADYAPHIINNSWSCPPSEGCTGGEFLDAVRALKAAGIFVVVSAGNEGPNCGSVQNPPAYYSGDVLSVGAYNRYQNDAASFSSRGPSRFNGLLAPFVTAPGSGIRSAYIGSTNSRYRHLSGTSMAGPHVAGVVALIWSAIPELIGKVDETTLLLAKSAVPLKSRQSCGNYSGERVPNAVFGYGMANAYNAIKMMRSSSR